MSPPAAAPLRVLLVHDAYRQRGGEDGVVDAEEALLRRHGHAVQRYDRHNDEIDGLSAARLARDTLWSARSVRELGALIAAARPDVVHLHNSFPLVSPSAVWAARRAGVPVVQTLHNFRLLCPQAMLLRDGRVCTDCVGRVPWRAVRHRCYRGSAAASALAALSLQLHRALGTWREQVTLFVALDPFCRALFVQGGLAPERIRIKPNFADLPAPAEGPRDGLLFVGRLAAEKGVALLADAVARLETPVPVRVAGDGPEAARLAACIADCKADHTTGPPRLQALGRLAAAQVHAEMARAQALVLPSLCIENHPRVLVEAFAHALPVLASRLGPLATLVEHGRTGLLFEPGDAAGLAQAMAWAAAHPQEMRRMGQAARRHFEQHWSADANHALLRAIYDEAIARVRAGRLNAA